MSPEELFSRDRLAQTLGMSLEETGPGSARVRMTVREDMLNGHGACHGGAIFALADTAFALACNSHGAVAVASGCSIEYLAPAGEGDELVAVATERALTRRTGLYDIEVTTASGELVAGFRGRSVLASGSEPARPR